MFRREMGSKRGSLPPKEGDLTCMIIQPWSNSHIFFGGGGVVSATSFRHLRDTRHQWHRIFLILINIHPGINGVLSLAGGGAVLWNYFICQVRLSYCFTPYQRLWLYNGAPLVAFYDTLGIRGTYSRLKPPASSRGWLICWLYIATIENDKMPLKSKKKIQPTFGSIFVIYWWPIIKQLKKTATIACRH